MVEGNRVVSLSALGRTVRWDPGHRVLFEMDQHLAIAFVLDRLGSARGIRETTAHK